MIHPSYSKVHIWRQEDNPKVTSIIHTTDTCHATLPVTLLCMKSFPKLGKSGGKAFLALHINRGEAINNRHNTVCPQPSLPIRLFTDVKCRRCTIFAGGKEPHLCLPKGNPGVPAKTLEHFCFCKHAFSKRNNLIAARNYLTNCHH